jgi:hypothetical protein
MEVKKRNRHIYFFMPFPLRKENKVRLVFPFVALSMTAHIPRILRRKRRNPAPYLPS